MSLILPNVIKASTKLFSLHIEAALLPSVAIPSYRLLSLPIGCYRFVKFFSKL